MLATRDQGVGTATMKRALVVTREVNKPNGYDVFLSYHPGDGPMRKRWALSTWPEHFATLSSGRACVFFDEHEMGTSRASPQRLKDGVARSRSLLALYPRTCPTRRACQFRVDGRPSSGPPGGGPRRRFWW